MIFFFSFFFVVFVARLFFLQVVKGEKYRRFARENYLKQIVVKSPRGIIYDRNGRILTDNIPSYSLSIDILKAKEEVIIRLTKLLDIDSSDFKREGNNLVLKNISFRNICAIEERRTDFPYVSILVEPLRRYNGKEVFLHPLGYCGEISRKEIKETGGYKQGDFIGKRGIEKEYESFLMGKDGASYVEVDARGNEVSALEGEGSFIPPIPGNSLFLTIDAELQRFSYNLLENKGAIIAMNPKTGEVLVYCSKPGFDPNLFSLGIPLYLWEQLKEDLEAPLWDRVKDGAYPPASVFKLATAIIGLKKGIVKENTKQVFPCDGSIRIGRRVCKCWEEHGSLRLKDAIIQSCDVYFYQLGMSIGSDEITAEAQKLGFGKETGIDMPSESRGFLPTRIWYNKRYGRGGWGRGVAANLAVGQGEILSTPLQILCFCSGVANYGLIVQPHILKKVVDSRGEEIFKPSPRVRRVSIDKEILEFIRSAMFGVVNSGKGTGRLAGVSGMKVAGKTGTAENPHGEDHAWFAAFAPYEEPEICIVVFVENGGMGGAVAAPIAGKIINAWMKNRRNAYSTSGKLQISINR